MTRNWCARASGPCCATSDTRSKRRPEPGGPEALKLVEDERFDTLVCDYLMPGMNGAELASKVKSAHPGIKVLIITGYAGGEIDVGFPKLAKPFRQTDLATALWALDRGDNVVPWQRRR